jgi:hypothetical protein
MTNLKSCLSALILTTILSPAHAIVIDFEGFSPSQSLTNINPNFPFREDGFTITPTDGSSAVFDSAYTASSMIGNSSDWFGFAESNNPTLTLTAASSPFNLNRILLGPSTIAPPGPIAITVTAHFAAGGSTSITYSNLATATLVSPAFSNLARVQFLTTDDAALDNIDVAIVPEPTTAFLGVISMLSLISVRQPRSLRRRA